MTKMTIDDLAKYPCHVNGCEEECILPYPWCGPHNAIAKTLEGGAEMAKSERHLTDGANGVRGAYHRWRQSVVRMTNAINAMLEDEAA